MQALKPYWLAAFSIFGLLAARIFILPGNIINPDCSMFLKTGQLIIAGARPYIDFIELNPPLVFCHSGFICQNIGSAVRCLPLSIHAAALCSFIVSLLELTKGRHCQCSQIRTSALGLLPRQPNLL